MPLSVQAKTKVVFLSPGLSSELFWVSFSDFMAAAADDLGLELRVLYAERDPQNTLQQAQALLKQTDLPDYVLFTNENYLAPEMLRLFEGSSVKVFLLHNALTEMQRAFLGQPRERYPNWIGSAVSNNEEAGFLTAASLLEHAEDGSELLAISGSRQTPVSQEREAGLLRALAHAPHVQLRQVVYGEWNRGRAQEQAHLLFQRYPNVRLVWTANDEMAFGAIDALQAQGQVAGKDVFFSTMNNSPQVLHARARNEVSVLAAGHFTLGGWALVMLADHASGIDFDNHGGLEQRFSLFRLFDAGDSKVLLHRVDQHDYKMDFKSFSARHLAPGEPYRFSLEALVR